jgi:DNA-binding winged helix-turn-helix (wHTH) protein
VRRRFGEFVLDDSQRQLLCDREGAVHMSPKAFELLSLLVDRAPAAVSKEEIVRVIWPDAHVSDASLTNVAAEIRAATRDRAREPRFVRTVHGFGYAFCGELSTDSERLDVVTWRLVVAGRPQALAQGVNVLGRDPDASVFVNDVSVSRRHASVSVHHGIAVIEDLQSRNGTFLNGQRLDAATELRDGDLIGLGPVALAVERCASDGSTQTHRPD